MQSLVSLAQLAQRRFEKCLVLVSLSGAQGCQSVQANIDADCGSSLVPLFIWQFKRDTHKPPISRFCHPCACHLAFEAQVLGHIHPSEFWGPEAMIPKLELIVGKIKTRFALLFAFKLGTAILSF